MSNALSGYIFNCSKHYSNELLVPGYGPMGQELFTMATVHLESRLIGPDQMYSTDWINNGEMTYLF